MFDVGFWELSLIALVALLVIGPERLPKVARVVGLWIGRGRRMIGSVKADIEREIKAEELKDILNKQARSNPLEEILGDTHETLDSFKRDTEKALGSNSGDKDGKKKPDATD